QGAFLQPRHGGGAPGRRLGAGPGLRGASAGQDRRSHPSGRGRAGRLLRPRAGDPCRQRRRAAGDAEARLTAKQKMSTPWAVIRPRDRARSCPAPNPLSGERNMRFMMLMIPKGYEMAEPGAMPPADRVGAMMKYNESL